MGNKKGKIKNYVEPAVSSHDALDQTVIEEKIDEEGFLVLDAQGVPVGEPTTYRVSFDNLLQTFNSKELNNKLETNIFPEHRDGFKFYEFTNNEHTIAESSGKKFPAVSRVVYRQTIFPQKKYTFLGKVRGRQRHVRDFWESIRDNRNMTVYLTGSTTNAGPRIGLGSITTGPSYVAASHGAIGERSEHARAIHKNSQGFPPADHSIWPLDARINFETGHSVKLTGSGGFARVIKAFDDHIATWGTTTHYLSDYLTSTSGSALRRSYQMLPTHWPGLTVSGGVWQGGEGELLNWYNFYTGAFGASYVWRAEEPILHNSDFLRPGQGLSMQDEGTDNAHGAVVGTTSSISWTGDTLWEAGKQAGKNPFYYDSYDQYASDIRVKGQDYSICPEFRISSHMETIHKNFEGNPFKLPAEFNRANKPYFELTGALVSNDLDCDFGPTYSHSEFLSNFSYHDDQMKDIGLAADSTIGLQCKALVKFLPYKNFYPVMKTLDLAKKFSGSYGDHVSSSKDTTTTLGVTVGTNPGYQSFITPLFAPGVLYNSIKAGLACDFPIWNSAPGAALTTVPYLSEGTDTRFVTASRRPVSELAAYHSGSTLYNTYEHADAAAPLRQLLATGPRRSEFFDMFSGTVGDSFSYRVPFEAIVDPRQYIQEGQAGKISNMQTHKLLRPGKGGEVVHGAWKGGQNDDLYPMAVNNFLAETIDFFLEDSKLTSFVSRPESEFLPMEKGKVYTMDLRLALQPEDAEGQWSYSLNRSAVNHSREFFCNYPVHPFHPNNAFYYDAVSRWSAFGPPSLGTYGGEASAYYIYPDYSPHAPCYANGPAYMRLTFNPPRDDVFSLQEIQSKLTASVVHANGSLLDTEGGNFAWYNSMPITSSINWDGSTRVDDVTFDENGNVVSIAQNPNGPNKVWAIQTKMEFPVADFSSGSLKTVGRSPTMPISGAKNVCYGMWHQYGVTASVAFPANAISSGSKQYVLNRSSYGDSQVEMGPFFELKDSGKVTWRQGSKEVLADPDSESLANIVGFQKAIKPLGRTNRSKELKECVVAIPFLETGRGKKFIKLNNKAVREYLKGNTELMDQFYPLSGDTIRNSLDIMKNAEYILPPRFDYVLNRKKRNSSFIARGSIEQPFLMFMFEFSHTLGPKDIMDIWQNLPPDIAYNFEAQESEVLKFSIEEVVDAVQNQRRNVDDDIRKLKEKMRWMVFKVKQRAKNNYFQKTFKNEDDDRFQFDFAIGDAGGDLKLPNGELKYSYNWPYDEFSLVELIKIQTEVEYGSAPVPEFARLE